MLDFVEVRLFEGSHPLYYLVIQRSHGKWPIEIDGLPINSMVMFHGYGTNNQMVILVLLISPDPSEFIRIITSVAILCRKNTFAKGWREFVRSWNPGIWSIWSTWRAWFLTSTICMRLGAPTNKIDIFDWWISSCQFMSVLSGKRVT